jgi:hypothetical protein
MKTIIEMAQEAGGYFEELPNFDAWFFDKEEQLEAFAELVRADEREACAQLIESLFILDDAVSEFIAKAIRARGSK